MQVLVIVFIALIVGVILLQASAQNIGSAVNTGVLVNSTQTLGAVNSSIYLTDYRAISDVIVTNNSNGAVISDGNYTTTNNVIYNGDLAVQITTDTLSEYASKPVNISGTVQPLTYIDDAGSRSMTSLVIIFFALTIGLIALYPVYESKMLELLGR